jgi:membrane protease subunit (stomatin/prohibitin family)
MALSDRIKWDMDSDDELVWKYPSEEILIGSQLIVGEGQQAVFCKSGELFDIFGPGRHTLTTANLPLLRKVVNFPFFGKKTPFVAEIWYVSKLKKMNILWGTKAPIPLMDHMIGVPVSVRAFGQWGYHATSPARLIKQFVGTKSSFSRTELADYMYGKLIQSLTESIAECFLNGISILEITNHLEKIADTYTVLNIC